MAYINDSMGKPRGQGRALNPSMTPQMGGGVKSITAQFHPPMPQMGGMGASMPMPMMQPQPQMQPNPYGGGATIPPWAMAGGMGGGMNPGVSMNPALQLPFLAGSQDRNTALMNFLRRLFAGGMR